MRRMNILENKVSCKYLYEKTRTLLVHVQGTCRKPNIQTRETSTLYVDVYSLILYIVLLPASF